MEQIQSVFLDTQLFCGKEERIDNIFSYLENTEPVFRAIAYESASMAVAIKDFSGGGDLDKWNLFTKGPARVHATHVYVGLGWALAKKGLPFESVAKKLDPLLRYRIADGCGYYDSIFRKRQVWAEKSLPSYLPKEMNSPYFLGIGRSFWYTSKGEPGKAKELIANFPLNRQAELWRGIGVAATYVGGSDEKTLLELEKYAGAFQRQLASGAAIATRVRTMGEAMTIDAEHACRIFCNLTAGEVNELVEDAEKLAGENDPGAYFSWIVQIEEGLHQYTR